MCSTIPPRSGLYMKNSAILAINSSPHVANFSGALQRSNCTGFSNRRVRLHVAFGAACALARIWGERHLLLAGQSAGKPIQAFVKTIARGGASRLDEPLPVPQIVQAQFFCHFSGSHRIWQILLVGEYQPM